MFVKLNKKVCGAFYFKITSIEWSRLVRFKFCIHNFWLLLVTKEARNVLYRILNLNDKTSIIILISFENWNKTFKKPQIYFNLKRKLKVSTWIIYSIFQRVVFYQDLYHLVIYWYFIILILISVLIFTDLYN